MRRTCCSNFIRQAITNEAITIFGDGSQTRSFCYRDDLVHGIIDMMDGPDDFMGPVNIGNPHKFTILELAELVIKLTDSKSKIINKPLPKDDPVRRRPISLAKQKLSWEPTVSLEDGLQGQLNGSVRLILTNFGHLRQLRITFTPRLVRQSCTTSFSHTKTSNLGCCLIACP